MLGKLTTRELSNLLTSLSNGYADSIARGDLDTARELGKMAGEVNSYYDTRVSALMTRNLYL